MRSLWPVWSKVVACFLLVTLLVLGVMAWAVSRTTGSTFPDLEEAEAVPLCTAYLQKVYGLRGSLQAPAGYASGATSTSDSSGKETLSATFYPASSQNKPRRFECTVRPATTGYTVTAFRWAK